MNELRLYAFEFIVLRFGPLDMRYAVIAAENKEEAQKLLEEKAQTQEIPIKILNSEELEMKKGVLLVS